MKRYRGELLPVGCRIAIIGNDAIGNYVVATPLFQLLRKTHQPSTLHIYSGPKTEELWGHDPNIDWGFPLSGIDPHKALIHAKGSYDLVVNLESSLWARDFSRLIAGPQSYVCGPSLDFEGRNELPFGDNVFDRLAADQNWLDPELLSRYECLETSFIGEIFCRIAHLKGLVPACRVPEKRPPFETPRVLIATAASLPEKLWTPDKWVSTVRWLVDEGFDVGIVGARPEDQRRYWFGDSAEEEVLAAGLATDLRGKLTLPEVVGALRSARLCFTIDNGILHLASTVGVPTLGLFREGFERLWAPPVPTIHALRPPRKMCVSDIAESEVIHRLEGVLSDKSD